MLRAQRKRFGVLHTLSRFFFVARSFPGGQAVGPAEVVAAAVCSATGLLALDVGQLLADEVILYLVNVDAADVACVARGVNPVVAVAHHAAGSDAENLLDFEARVGGFAEEVLQVLGNSLFAHAACSVRGGMRGFKDAIIAD